MTHSSIVNVSAVTRSFGAVHALKGVDFHAQMGQITALLGPNGAGKTTLLEICEGLQRADSGTVRVLGLDPSKHARALRPRVGVMIQDGGLPLSARSGELLTHVARMYASPRDVGKLSQELGLISFSRTQVRHLSGGMRQRLAMAIALVGNPELVFLDEPSAGLDPAARREVWEFIAGVKEQGTTIILTSHLMDEVEYLADEVYILNSGEVIARGSVDELVSLEPPSDAPTALDHTASVRVRGAMTQADYAELQRWTQMRGLTVSQRSLEDAFLDLTGRTLQ